MWFAEFHPAYTHMRERDGYAWLLSLTVPTYGLTAAAETVKPVKVSSPRCECGNIYRLCHPEA